MKVPKSGCGFLHSSVVLIRVTCQLASFPDQPGNEAITVMYAAVVVLNALNGFLLFPHAAHIVANMYHGLNSQWYTCN